MYSYLLPNMNEQSLQRAISDVTTEIHNFCKDKDIMLEANVVEMMSSQCECCGFIEDCTPNYARQVKDSHSGKWVCGLCSEAVKERIKRVPRTAMEEAVSFHKDLCQKFNSTTRLDPKLSFTTTMRDLVKRSSHHRKNNLSIPKISRSSSCVPRIDFK